MNLLQKISYRTSTRIIIYASILGILLLFISMALKWIANNWLCLPFRLFYNSNRVGINNVKNNDNSLAKKSTNQNRQILQSIDNLKEKRKAKSLTCENVSPKYMFIDRTSPKFKEFLRKSNRPFLGYVSVDR